MAIVSVDLLTIYIVEFTSYFKSNKFGTLFGGFLLFSIMSTLSAAGIVSFLAWWGGMPLGLLAVYFGGAYFGKFWQKIWN